MNILQLLQQSGYPATWVQGHHTRILAFDNGEFEVIARRYADDPSSPYETRWYIGNSEHTAVEEFIKSEEN